MTVQCTVRLHAEGELAPIGDQGATPENRHRETRTELGIAQIVGFPKIDQEPEQHRFIPIVLSRNAPAKPGELGILRRILKEPIDAFPKADLLAYLDGGVELPQVFRSRLQNVSRTVVDSRDL